MFNKTDKRIDCDIKGCHSTTIVLFFQDVGWRWLNEKDICPKSMKLNLYEKEFKDVSH